MAILVDTNNGLSYYISDFIIEEPPGSGQIFDNIKTLANTLSSISGITRTNLGAVQSTIQSANSSFNVFAVVSHSKNSEDLVGVTSSNGKRTFVQENFVYNMSASNTLSTGKTIADMSGGVNYSLPEIDGKKWMGMAVYDGTTNGFRGIMLWVFTNDLISSTNSIITGTGGVTNAASIFHPSSFGATTSYYRRIYQVVVGPNGGISASNVTGGNGWLFSTSHNSRATGYLTFSKFSADDGIWAFVLGGKVNGETPGPSYKRANGFGLGNVNSVDYSSSLYWAGNPVSSTNYVGFVFTGDS